MSLGVVPDPVERVPAKIGRRWIDLNVVNNTFYVKSKKAIGIPLNVPKSLEP
jgi:hypothetical protein